MSSKCVRGRSNVRTFLYSRVLYREKEKGKERERETCLKYMPGLLNILSKRFLLWIADGIANDNRNFSSLNLETMFLRQNYRGCDYHLLLLLRYRNECIMSRSQRTYRYDNLITKYRRPKTILSEHTDFDRRQ